MSVINFGVKIYLDDQKAPVTETETYGIYNRYGAVSWAESGQSIVVISDTSIFRAGELIGLRRNDLTVDLYTILSIIDDTHLEVVGNLSTTYENFIFGGSVIKWIQNTVDIATMPWIAGIIAESGFGIIKKSIDVQDGGNVAAPGGATLTIDNTKDIRQELEDLDINIRGCLCEIIEIVDTVETIKFTGFIDSLEWTATAGEISIKQSTERRRANIMGVYNETDAGVLFGSHVYPIPAKTIPVTTSDTRYIAANFSGIASCYPTDKSVYYIVSGTKKIFRALFFSTATFNVDGLDDFCDWLVDKYVRIISGENKGYIRKISSAVHVSANTVFDITVENSFLNGFFSNVNTWFELINYSMSIKLDTFQSLGNIDNTGAATNQTIAFYDEGAALNEIPENTIVDVGNNLLHINPEMNYETLSDVDAPITITPNEISVFSESSILVGDVYQKFSNGIYLRDSSTGFVTGGGAYTGQANATDKTIDTYFLHNSIFTTEALAAGANRTVDIIIAIKIPVNGVSLPGKFDSFRLGLKSLSTIVGGVPTGMTITSTIYAQLNDWFSSTRETVTGQTTTAATLDYNNIPVSYFIGATGSDDDYYSNINFLKSTIFDEKNIQIVDTINLLFRYQIYIPQALSVLDEDFEIQTKIYEVALMFDRTLNLTDDIFVNRAGRVFADTWGTRKTATALIDKPLDVLEHVCRLQNYTESAIEATAGAGLSYSQGAKINVADAFGGFDNTDSNVVSLAAYPCAREIVNREDADTDTIKKSLCKDFFLTSWVDSTGKENVYPLVKSSTSPAITITLADVMDRNGIKIKEQDTSRIFCNPLVRYNYNHATGKYDNMIKITHASAAIYDSSYVEGVYYSQQKEYLWELAHALWIKNRTTAEPPEELSNLLWANGDSGSMIAYAYIANWMRWMSTRFITIPLHYLTVKDWELCKRVNVQLPHFTDNNIIECMVVGIELDINAPYICTVEFAMLETTGIPEDTTVQNVVTVLTGDNLWQNTTDTGNENIQNV